MRSLPLFHLFFGLLLVVSTPQCFAAPDGHLQVGAARVDITPPVGTDLPMAGYSDRKEGFQQIHDHIYVRAIVLSDGTNQAALLSWELVGMPNGVWQELSQRITKKLGIPTENMILAAVHDHSAPSLDWSSGANDAARTRSEPTSSPATITYTKEVEDDAFEAVRRAQANLQPAQVGFGTGKAYININRREFYPQKGWWWLGHNPDGPSDKTVAVLKFADLSGRPIAFFINYPVHCTVMGPENLAITGDIAGATSRYVEQYYQGKIRVEPDEGWEERVPSKEITTGGDGPVAVWTAGASGDQNPISMDRGEDFTMVDGLGRILGEETVRVANTIADMSSQVTILGSQRVITCPGRRLLPGPRPSKDYSFEDADPVNIRLSLLRVNNIALVGVSGEVFTRIYQHLHDELPESIMVTHANGSSSYIPSDDSFDPISYEVVTSHLKPGCAEPRIINGILEMMEQK